MSFDDVMPASPSLRANKSAEPVRARSTTRSEPIELEVAAALRGHRLHLGIPVLLARITGRWSEDLWPVDGIGSSPSKAFGAHDTLRHDTTVRFGRGCRDRNRPGGTIGHSRGTHGERGADGGHRRDRHRHHVREGRRRRRRRDRASPGPVSRTPSSPLPRTSSSTMPGWRGTTEFAPRRSAWPMTRPEPATASPRSTPRRWFRRCARWTATACPPDRGCSTATSEPGDPTRGLNPSEDGEAVRMLAWLTEHHPDAAGYWPAQAVASSVLTGGGPGSGTIDTRRRHDHLPALRLRVLGRDGGRGRRERPRSSCRGSCRAPSPPVDAPTTWARRSPAPWSGAARSTPSASSSSPGPINDGDVLVILGATLIIWACVPNWFEAPGLWTMPHTAPGKVLIGGPSNAGGLLRELGFPIAGVADPPRPPRHRELDPRERPGAAAVPPWGTDAAARSHASRARSTGSRSPTDPMRCGVRSTRRPATPFATTWNWRTCSDRRRARTPRRARRPAASSRRAGAPATWVGCRPSRTSRGCPSTVSRSPRVGHSGAAYLARAAADLEPDASGAGRWASTGRRVEPDPAWHDAAMSRYAVFVAETGEPYVGES